MPPCTMTELHGRFMGGLLTSEVPVIDNNAMKSEFEKFHDYTKYPEEMYTDDVLLLLKSKDQAIIENANKMIQVRTDSDFYLQCHVMAKIFDLTIRYLGDQSSNSPILLTPLYSQIR